MKPLILAVFAALHVANALAATPYAGQESREIKSLSPEDVQATLAGKGMGLAKAAELNGYPGPAHVLELAGRLQLSEEQRERTQALFAAMEAKAMSLGRALIERERALDGLFAGKAATPERLSALLSEIGALQAQVRGAHLEAHVAQLEILTPAQTARYAELRGYGAAKAPAGHSHKH